MLLVTVSETPNEGTETVRVLSSRPPLEVLPEVPPTQEVIIKPMSTSPKIERVEKIANIKLT